jgi:release factor glutamine methyltransferase
VTVGSLLADATRRFEAAGIANPRLDADVLGAWALGRDRAWVLGHAGDELGADLAAVVEAAIVRREQREPVAYILGSAGFRRLELQVDARVLVPRPETELLVELAVDQVIRRAAGGIASAARVLDLCTGSGAVALAIADESPLPVRVTATDLSPGAVAVARANASRLGLEGRVQVVAGDLFEALPVDEPAFDVITANPPYVDRADLDTLMPDVRDHEPHVALFVPEGTGDPLALALDIVAHAPAWLTPGGLLAIEVGAGQAMRLATAMRERDFDAVHTVCDLSGIERIVAGRWAA